MLFVSFVLPLWAAKVKTCLLLMTDVPFLRLHPFLLSLHFPSLGPQVHPGEAGRRAGDPGVQLSHFDFHQIPAVTFARPGARHL